jgi:hypothetical protein
LTIAGRVSLPLASFYTAWLAVGLGEPPTPLLPAGGTPPRPDGGAATVVERAWTDLYERGLAAGRVLDGEFVRTLRALVTAPQMYYAFFHRRAENTRSALVVSSGVLVSVAGGWVTLRRVWRSSVPDALVEDLPSAPKGTGETLSASIDELAEAPAGFATRRPTGRAAEMRWLLSQPRLGGGQLFAARRDSRGERTVCPRPLSYFDIAAGRYLATEAPAPDGTRWRTILPADTALLIERLRELLPR